VSYAGGREGHGGEVSTEREMLLRRLWSQVDKSAGPGRCWPWTGTLNNSGYGRIYVNGRKVLVHRLAYELEVGPIGDGLEIDHVRARGCQSTACCNPAHLEAVTPEENRRRADLGRAQAAKTHCPQGHLYAGENLRIKPDGSRECRTCKRANERRFRLRRRNKKGTARSEAPGTAIHGGNP